MAFWRRFLGRKAATDDVGVSRARQEARPRQTVGTAQTTDERVDEEGLYHKRCLEQAYFEEDEPRSWHSHPEFRKVLDPLNEGDYARACEEAENLAATFADFGVVYCWWAKALLETRSYDRAREIVRQGLARSRSKFALCNQLGEIEWKSGNIKEAVYWWAQGLHCQESLKGYGGAEGAYLYLHYVADALGLSRCASAFLLRVDQVRPGGVRLTRQPAHQLRRLAWRQAPWGTPEILEALVDRYILM